ncbi:transcription regulator [Saccharomyces cerevisiae]|nr:transcription regulator [Saccharomyces cerevisiae]
MDYNKRSSVSTVPNAAPIRVGFVGLNAAKGWAIKTHYPAILQLSSQFQITALYSPKIETSIATIQRLKLSNATAFPTLESFASSSTIDMIVIAIQVASHYEVVMPLLEFSKNNPNLKYLFVEWALACSLDQAESIYKAAAERGVQTIISLQGRKSRGWYGYERPVKSPKYIYEIGNGVDLVTTTFGHTIDILQYMTSSYFSRINAMVFNNIPEQELIDERGNRLGQRVPKTVPDHLLFQGTLLNGNVPVSCSFKGGKPTKKFTKNLVIDIHGTKGDLKLEGDAGFAEISNLVLYYSGTRANDFPLANGQQAPLDPGYDAGKEIMEVYHLRNYNAIVGNIHRLYQSISDFHFNTKKIPELPSQFVMQGFDFEGFPTLMDALILHRLIESVYKSNMMGSTLNVSNISHYSL